MRLIFASLFVIYGAGVNSQGVVESRFLYNQCVSNETHEQAFCIGYINGIFEGLTVGIYEALAAGGETGNDVDNTIRWITAFCPKGNYLSFRDEFIKRYGSNKGNQPARLFLIEMARSSFPCR